jgi:hypothetical protein
MTPSAAGATPRHTFSSAARQPCVSENCFATFESGSPDEGDVRHCNRSGPDGGHAQRWDGRRWQVVTGRMQHDRT